MSERARWTQTYYAQIHSLLWMRMVQDGFVITDVPRHVLLVMDNVVLGPVNTIN